MSPPPRSGYVCLHAVAETRLATPDQPVHSRDADILFDAPRATVPGRPAISSSRAKVDDVELHYLAAGHGPAVLLLHGYAETSRMWRSLMPRLVEKLMVIAPDLPGIGDSSIPEDRIDMITAAT